MPSFPDDLCPQGGEAPCPSPTPWACRHYPDVSEIEAYADDTGQKKIIAETFNAPYCNAQANAEHIVRTINQCAKMRELIADMLTALEMCLECEGLTWEAEQEADIMCTKAKNALHS